MARRGPTRDHADPLVTPHSSNRGGPDLGGRVTRARPRIRGPHTIPGDEDLYSENLPEIKMTDEQGNVIHASHSLQDYRVEYACRYVLAHLHENINRDKMAEMVNLSPGRFSNLFRQEVGKIFSNYPIQVRDENAKSPLRRFDLSVDAISKRCGFHSLAYSSRTFKDRWGMSPLKLLMSPHS